MMRGGGYSTSVLMLIGMLIVSVPCHAENMQRETCSAVPGRGYFGGCPQMENHVVSRDAPESGFPDPMAACRQANEAVKQALTEQMKSFDRRHPGGFPSCLNLTIRCEPCGRVQK